MMKRSGSERVHTGACAMMPAATGVAGGGAAHAVPTPARLADVDGDGRDDIVGFGYSATTVRLAKAGRQQ